MCVVSKKKVCKFCTWDLALFISIGVSLHTKITSRAPGKRLEVVQDKEIYGAQSSYVTEL